jgi:hypothetical protein
MNTTTINEVWYCFAVQYWRDGKTHIESMDDVFATLDLNNINECFSYPINLRMSSYPSRMIYDGIQIPRTEENELLFKKIEAEPTNARKSMGYKILEIWRYSFKEIG